MMQGYVYVEVNDKLRQLLNTIFTDEFMKANTNFEILKGFSIPALL